MRPDAGLREIDQGEWTGLRTDEIRLRWPHLWGLARHFKGRPGGESPGDVRARAIEALERIVASHADGTVVVVSHGGPIRWLTAAALGYSDRESARLRGLSNGGAVALDVRFEGGGLVFDGVERMDGESPDLDDPDR